MELAFVLLGVFLGYGIAMYFRTAPRDKDKEK